MLSGARRPWGKTPLWRWIVRGTVALALAIGLAELPPWLFRESGLDRYFELRDRVVQIRQRNRARRRANALLRAEAADLEKDPLAIERVARDQLGLVRPGEIIFQLERDPKRSEPKLGVSN